MKKSFALMNKACGMAIVIFFSASLADNYSQWIYHEMVTLNTTATGANVASTIVNFPVLIRLDSAHNASVFAQAGNQGADLRFANAAGISLPYQIEQWNSANKNAAVWVLLDTIQGNNSSQYITMYWGNAGAASASGGPSVFDTANGFAGVWHMSSSDFSDATAHGWNAINGGTQDTVGIIGGCRKFTILDPDSITLPGIMGSPAAITISCWVNTDSLDAGGKTNGSTIMSIADFLAINELKTVDNTTDSMHVFYYCYPGTNTWRDVYETPVTGNQLYKQGWKHVAYVIDPVNSFEAAYINGVQVLQSAYSDPIAYTTAYGYGGTDSKLGCFGGPNTLYHNYMYFGGLIDEPRVENVPRSADWIQLCFENQQQNQELITMGPPISNGVLDAATARQKSPLSLRNGVLAYVLDRPSSVHISLCDIRGRTTVLFDQRQPAGNYRLPLNRDRLVSGRYIIHFVAGGIDKMLSFVVTD